LNKWESLYNHRYPDHLKFPEFRKTLFKVFSIEKEKELYLWAKKIMNCIRGNRLMFGFAFDGDMNKDIRQSLKYFDDQFISEIGEKNKLFYFAINRDKSFDIYNRSQLFE
jgi:hypothetical protein